MGSKGRRQRFTADDSCAISASANGAASAPTPRSDLLRMSRSIARALDAIIGAVTAPLSRTRGAMTIARLMERLDARSATVIQTARGPLKVLPHRGPHLAAAALDFDNEEPETLAWIDTFQDGETLWDVGAATGLLSMYAALKAGVRVYAFEPKATSFGVLIEH